MVATAVRAAGVTERGSNRHRAVEEELDRFARRDLSRIEAGDWYRQRRYDLVLSRTAEWLAAGGENSKLGTSSEQHGHQVCCRHRGRARSSGWNNAPRIYS